MALKHDTGICLSQCQPTLQKNTTGDLYVQKAQHILQRLNKPVVKVLYS